MAEGRELLLVAGEASGDLHGGALLQALRRLAPDLAVAGVGGERLRAAGMDTLVDVSSLSAAGVVEILGSIRRHHRVMRLLKQRMDRRRPAAVVLIDYPGFNLFVAREAHRRGIPVFFYIAPQVWAWGRGRARRMAGFIDRLAVIFPFEEGLFNAHGRAFASYVGHPILDEIEVTATAAQTRRRHGLDPQRPLLALMPGSRRSEIRLLLPPLLAAAERLRRQGWQVVLLRASTIDPTVLEREAGLRPLPLPCIAGDTVNLLHAADAGLVSSGTATLQAALLGCPHVIVYRFNWLTNLLGRLVTRHRVLGLPNVILGRMAFPELLQERANADELVAALQALLVDRPGVEAAIAELQRRMGPPGASARAAEVLLELLP